MIVLEALVPKRHYRRLLKYTNIKASISFALKAAKAFL